MIIDIIKSILLGIVEGITEFLPISSTGHLIIVNKFLSFSPDFTFLFDILIQLGAISAVIVFFWSKLCPIKQKKLEPRNDRWLNREVINIWLKALVGIIPAIVVGLIASDFIEKNLFNSVTVAIALFVGGIILILIERRKQNPKFNSIKEMGYASVLAIGLFQCLAMIPGTSRSAATIIGGLIVGGSRVVAVEFSFFLAIPTIIAASGYSLLKHGFDVSSNEIILLAIGFAVSFIVALGVIKYFMGYIKSHDMKIFGYYRIILAIIVLLYWFF